jgi:hypothetical protein
MTLKRARDFALYIVVGVAVSLCIVWYALRSGGGGADPIGRWVGLAGTTLILFGYAIKAHSRLSRRLSFWAVILALLIVHVSAFIVILGKVEHWRILWFVLAYPVENIAIDGALSLTGHDVSGRGRRRPLSW